MIKRSPGAGWNKLHSKKGRKSMNSTTTTFVKLCAGAIGYTVVMLLLYLALQTLPGNIATVLRWTTICGLMLSLCWWVSIVMNGEDERLASTSSFLLFGFVGLMFLHH
jgi:FtsH-binding integral membrane protein